jgi:hypothetical protein
MAEEAPTTPVEEDGAPVTDIAAPGESEAPASPPEGYVEEKRFQDARNELNRQFALRDRARQGDAEALRELVGFDFAEEDEQDPDQGDEYEEPGFQDPRVDALIQEREQQRQEQQQQEGWSRFNADLDKVAGDKSKTLTDDDRLVLYTKTLQNGATPDALNTAYDDFAKARAAYDKAVVQAYIESKRAPHVSQGGTGATDEVLPLDATHDQRVAYMAQRLGLSQEY